MKPIYLESIKLFPEPIAGIVLQPIMPNCCGRVQALATVWSAKFYNPTCQAIAAAGSSVAIVGRQGIKLLIVLESTT
jgi:membrane protein implicated in regulation of membrane protease activity